MLKQEYYKAMSRDGWPIERVYDDVRVMQKTQFQVIMIWDICAQKRVLQERMSNVEGWTVMLHPIADRCYNRQLMFATAFSGWSALSGKKEYYNDVRAMSRDGWPTRSSEVHATQAHPKRPPGSIIMQRWQDFSTCIALKIRFFFFVG